MAFFNSTFFQSIAIVLAAVLAAVFAIKQLYDQQRTNRLQKIYFEDSLLKQLQNLDIAFSAAYQNIDFAVTAVDLISNFIDQIFVDKQTLIASIEQIIDRMKVPEPSTNASKEIIFNLFGDRGARLIEWLAKAEQDYKTFYALLTGQMLLLLNSLKIADARGKETDNARLEYATKNIKNNFNLVVRSQVLISLFSKLVQEFGTMDFKSKKELMRAAERPEISRILDKTDECFKILYGFYKADNQVEHIFYSYAKDESGNQFKLIFRPFQIVTVLREKPIKEFKGLPVFVMQESQIADAAIDNGQPFIMELIRLANLHDYGHKPDILLRIQKFV